MEVGQDAVLSVQAGDLAVRWNCRAGKCGSCSAEINGYPKLMCMTRLSSLPPGEPVTVTPLRTVPLIKDLVTDVSANYDKARQVPAFRPRPAEEADGTYRMTQADVGRSQEFRTCIEVCSQGIKITDNAIIPLKERARDGTNRRLASRGLTVAPGDGSA